ncbi:MAG: T9SS type A sorting domain-containing protein [Ignavibacteria bacterium]|jgi:enterochelin esterase family protein|nr:T9SS type A sorting domain-containing protein [Ignavibacteria bacterium]MCU7522552.1 T9SS type A sorting domain-containing protein [Ignavibacteria bacterium]
MKKLTLLLVLCFCPAILLPQSEFQNFISRVNTLNGSPQAQAAVIDSFMNYAKTKGIPFIDGSTANFLYRGNAASVSVAGDFNDWNAAKNMMVKLSGTDLYYFTGTFEQNARLDYKLVLNGSSWILDPLNPHQVSGGYGPNSEFAMPGYVQPWEINYKPSVPHGKVEERTTYSQKASINYQIRIYLPPGYSPEDAERYPAIYFQDGFDYIGLGSAVNVIDNLLDSGKIKPVIAVFVQPNNRNDEYAGGKRIQYREFFAYELVPLIDSLYKTIKDPKGRLVLGDSYGGNISALISFNHPDIFGNCGLHSGAFQPYNYEAAQLISSKPLQPVKLFSVWGSYEGLYQFWRPFKDSLLQKGYALKWGEYPEGHSWGLWRATLDDMLKYFFPKEETLVENGSLKPSGFELQQNYPNPFNPSTTIIFTVSEAGQYSIRLYDMLGREVAVIAQREFTQGRHSVSFNSDGLPSGVYLYRLEGKGVSLSRKMTLLR